MSSGRRAVVDTVAEVVRQHLPEGYVEEEWHGMTGWVVPLELGPRGRSEPLLYAAVAARLGYCSLFLRGLHTDGPERAWFRQQYADRGLRLEMGRASVRFRTLEDLPLDVVGEVVGMIELDEFVARHESTRGAR